VARTFTCHKAVAQLISSQSLALAARVKHTRLTFLESCAAAVLFFLNFLSLSSFITKLSS
jgi:hypothetical protein